MIGTFAARSRKDLRSQMIAYLDHNATTCIDDRLLEPIAPYLRKQYGVGSSRHGDGGGTGTGARRHGPGVANTVWQVENFLTALAAAVDRLHHLSAVAVQE
ncbi:MAG: hypothetical protein GTO41_27250 [Burkholderiales bacterium]|nr:hypothetical protein [Burkholderiales bacterium]